MVRKKLDERIRRLLERSIAHQHRSMLILVGDYGKDQVPNLYYLLSKTQLSASSVNSDDNDGSGAPTVVSSSSLSNARKKVLWCYKKDLGFSTHRQKRMKQLKKRQRTLSSSTSAADDNASTFELFLTQTDITWCFYRDVHRVLGTTVGMLVLADFESLTPNVLAKTMETVCGGGCIVLLLKTVKSLKQLYTMSMDVHARYRTEAQADVVPRFNERFLLSLAHCSSCLVCDDEFNILPTTSRAALRQLRITNEKQGRFIENNNANNKEATELLELKTSLQDTPHVGALMDLCQTLDQARALLILLESLSDTTTTATSSTTSSARTIAMTAARGRGKSVALGLALAGALSMGGVYTHLGVSAPEPENIATLMEFVVRGLDALQYRALVDYTVRYNHATGRDATKVILGVTLHATTSGSQPQQPVVLNYIAPNKEAHHQLAHVQILAIDEAAAIPLPIVKKLLGMERNKNNNKSPNGNVVNARRFNLLSSTIHGYEGTGRALSLKLLAELRKQQQQSTVAAPTLPGPKSKKGTVKIHEQRWAAEAAAAAGASSSSFMVKEIELSSPIRYASQDPIEAWLNSLLCLDCGEAACDKSSGAATMAPAPLECELYHVNRDALFSHHSLSEAFLQNVWSLYTSAHYKNSPNDLQMLSDAPAHELYCLVSNSAPTEQEKKKSSDDVSSGLPLILAVVQVALEGQISKKSVQAQLARGHRSAGDLIPWTLSQQFGDAKFAQLSGARIVRIATHPSFQGMGYGTRAMELLCRFYNGEMISLLRDDDDDDDESDEDEEASKQREEEEDSDEEFKNLTGIRGERLTPRKQLPPLLVPLTEIKAPRLDWIGTSFGLTAPLFRFWSRAAGGMKLLYLRQTANELTGEHSAIMVRALPKSSSVQADVWLKAFVADSQRRILSLLSGGAFSNMSVRLALGLLENLHFSSSSTDDDNDDKTKTSTSLLVEKRLGVSATSTLSIQELNYFLTPHDLKRLELYGRNLCDYHLVTDLLPSVARLYFLGRFGPSVQLSSLQSALLCGIGVQHQSIDGLSIELGLPANQVLAMFNKAVRKLSNALHSIVEQHEVSTSLLSDKDRGKAEKAAARMQDVASKTLEEDAADGARVAMEKLSSDNQQLEQLDQDNKGNQKIKTPSALPQEITEDDDIMQYAIKGSKEEWSRALEGRDMNDGGRVQIKSLAKVSSTPKRKLNEQDVEKEIEAHSAASKQKHSKKKKKKRRSTK